MKKNSIKANIIFSLLYQMMIIIVPLITTPYIARVLEADGIGVYSITATNVGYFILFGVLGLGTYGQLEIAKVKDDIEKRSKCFFEIVVTRILTHSISIIGYIILIVLTDKYKSMYIIQGTLLLASLFDVTWYFQGIEEFRKISIKNMIIKGISVVAVLCFIKKKEDLPLYAIIISGSVLLSNLCMFPSLRNNVCGVSPKELKLKRHIKGSLVFFIPSIASMIISSVDKTMLDAITQMPEENGYYAQAFRIENLCMSLFSSINLVMRSKMANLHFNSNDDEVFRLLQRSLRFVSFFAFPISLGLLSISGTFVPWFFGDGYEKVSILLPIFSGWMIFKSISNCILEQDIMASGKQKVFNAIIWAGTITNIILNSVLIRSFLSVGAAVASVLSEFCIFVLAIRYSRSEITFIRIFQMSWKYLTAATIMTVINIVFGISTKPSIFVTTLQIGVGVIIYFSILSLLRDMLWKEMIGKVIIKIQRK